MNHLLNSDYTNLRLHLTRRETEEGEDMTVALLASLCLVLVAAAAAVENSTKTPPPPLGPLLSDYVVQVHSLRGKTNFLRVYLVRPAHVMHAHILPHLPHPCQDDVGWMESITSHH